MGGSLRIGPLRAGDDGSSARLVNDGGEFSISYTAPEGIAVAETIDPVFVASLLPAMKHRQDLVVDEPISPQLLRASERIQDIFSTWDRAIHRRSPWYRRTQIDATPAAPREGTAGRGIAAFFTGGVDSFHTAIERREELDALIYVWGFDVPADDAARRQLVGDHLRAAAKGLGLPLIEITTDVRPVMQDRFGIPWLDQHGAALASVALFLAPTFSRVYVPSTSTYAQLESLGSHPLLDPLWSTEDVELVHDGASATRVQKVRAIAADDTARKHLRVCWQNVDGRYNCGRCEKCVRTAVAARVMGVGGSFALLPEPSTLDVARTPLSGPSHAWFECREELVWSKQNPRLRWAIEVALARRQAERLRDSVRRPR